MYENRFCGKERKKGEKGEKETGGTISACRYGKRGKQKRKEGRV